MPAIFLQDFDSDEELHSMLIDFLHTLLARTPSDTLEYVTGKRLLQWVRS